MPCHEYLPSCQVVVTSAVTFSSPEIALPVTSSLLSTGADPHLTACMFTGIWAIWGPPTVADVELRTPLRVTDLRL